MKLFIAILPASLILLALILSGEKSRAVASGPSSLSLDSRPDLKIIRTFNTNLLRGVFIVADPRIIDPNFSRTVVLLIHNEEDGSTGLIINRPTSASLSEQFPAIKEHLTPSDRVFKGGPVLPKTLTLLFQTKTPPAGMIPVLNNTYVSREMRLMADLPMSTILDRRFRVFSGYAGWGPGQLQAEIVRGDWRVVRTGADIIFEGSADIIWEEMFGRSQERSVQNNSLNFRGEPA
ncbi:MAG: YqgE/AlgH family protein [Nitrospira sp.]